MTDHNPVVERIARHLEVERATIDVAAVGSEGRIWPPLAILLPHLLRHRIVAVMGEDAALVAVRAITLVPVRTVWSGPVSSIRIGPRGTLHSAVEIGGHRLLMQSPARDELEAMLSGRSTTPSADDLRELVGVTSSSSSIEQLSRDEHLRYDLYLEALSLVELSAEPHLIEIVLRDPDHAMREGAMGVLVDRRAATLGAECFARWFAERQGQLAASPFALERAGEWLVYGEVISDANVDPDRYLTASDWLQRKLADDAESRAVLDELAARGRTRKVRARAAERRRDMHR